MIRAIRAELRKLLTVRSTYVVLLIAVLLNLVVSFWVNGYKMDQPVGAHFLQANLLQLISGIGFFVGITPILLITHEYRHNLIYYTLTANRSRTVVFLSKLAVVVKYAAVFMLLNMLVGAFGMIVGLHMGHHALPAQQFDWWPLIWQSGFYLLAVSFMAVIFAFIIRNQIGAFVTYLLYPGTVEGLLGLLLKSKAGYLPFNAISNVIQHTPNGLDLHKAAVVAAAWVAFGLVVSWALFLKRDAN